MRYIGGKTNLLANIQAVVDAHCVDNGKMSFCDLFSGVGTVARFFKPRYRIIANDALYFAYLLTAATVENNIAPTFEKLRKKGIAAPVDYLTSVPLAADAAGFITDNYSPFGAARRQYLSIDNARRVDFIRGQIENWKNDRLLGAGEYKYLLAGLLEAIPFVSNITGTYGAYLKHWDKRALKALALNPLPVIDNGCRNICFNEDANELIKKISGDILYLDPPYNNRQYLPNYHLLETVARNDSPTLSGVTGMRPYQNEQSDYCRRGKVAEAFDTLLREADFRHIIVSYSDDGLLTAEAIGEMLKTRTQADSVKLTKIPYARYKGKLPQENHQHCEYIFYAQKSASAALTAVEMTAPLQCAEPPATYDSDQQLVKSPMNYIGGKYKILPQVLTLFPREIGTFVDLFAGGFNVAANVSAAKTVCNDMNYKVVEMVRLFCYADADRVLRRIADKIAEYQLSKDNEAGYKKFRDYYNATGNPIDLFTLSCFSFNYQFRFNNRLEYNNPFGRNRSCFSATTQANLLRFIETMRRKDLVFLTRDFREVNIDDLGAEDFIYCDPPYLISNGSYNDGNRGFHDWREQEEKDLCAFLDTASKKKIRFALSNVLTHKNAANGILTEWAKKYQIHAIDKNYDHCNYQTKNRLGKTQEVLITNY